MTVGKKMKIGIIVAVVAVLVMTAVDVATLPQSNGPNDPSGKIQVVAAENFWGSLVSQFGGQYVNVVSIVSDPNADPHEYESNVTDAKEIATANYIIINGVGYDTWAQNLIGAGIEPYAKVLNCRGPCRSAGWGQPPYLV